MENYMDSELIRRYIYAVTRHLPRRSREDVAKELHTLIADMLEERCGQVMPSEKDIRVVLTELGTPSELYGQYSGDGKKCLIGPPYYAMYLHVLKIVMICAPIGMTLVFAISVVSGVREEYWFFEVARWIMMMFSGSVTAFAFITALFAFFYHREIPMEGASGLDNLPPVPEKSDTISKCESVFGIGLSAVFVLVFLCCPQIICAVTDQGELIPVFDAQAVRGTWYVIIALGLAGIAGEAVKLMDGRYTRRVMVTAIVCDLVSGICSAWWLLGNNLLNQELIQMILEYTDYNEVVRAMFVNLQLLLWGVIITALAADAVIVAVKTARTEKKEEFE